MSFNSIDMKLGQCYFYLKRFTPLIRAISRIIFLELSETFHAKERRRIMFRKGLFRRTVAFTLAMGLMLSQNSLTVSATEKESQATDECNVDEDIKEAEPIDESDDNVENEVSVEKDSELKEKSLDEVKEKKSKNEEVREENIINGDFETGDLTGWTLMNGEDASDNNVGVVSDESTYWGSRNMYMHGNYCLRGESKENLSGQIRSSSFRLGGDGYISFMIGSAAKEGKGCIKLYEEKDGDDELISTYVNNNWNDPKTGLTLIRVFDKIDEKYLGHTLYFVIENGSEAGFSFINADDFRTSMTKDEVVTLQDSQLKEIAEIEDEYSDYIISCYRKNGIINDIKLKQDAPDSIRKYEGQVIDFADTIAACFKVEKVYSNELLDVGVDINEIKFNNESIEKIDGDVKLKKGTYSITYTARYADKSMDKTIDIIVEAVDKTVNEVDNGGFETGDLYGWEVKTPEVWNKNTDGDYAGVVSQETYWNEKLPFNQGGNYHLDGWQIANNESDSWALKSSVFTLDGSGYISVKMGGNAAAFRVYELDGTLVGEYKQNRFSDTNFPFVNEGGSWADMGTYFVNLKDYIGQPLYIELRDNKINGGWAVAFFDDVKTYYKNKPDIENGYDTVTGPVTRNGDELEYGSINIPWQELSFVKGDVKLSFEEDGFEISNALGTKEAVELESNFKDPAFQDAPVLPYRPNGVNGKALNFDGYSNYAEFKEHVAGSFLTVDAYVCPRAFMWDSPSTPKEEQIPTVIAGSYDSGAKAGFLLGYTKHGYLTYRVGTGENWYSLSSEDGNKVSLYQWNRITGVFDGNKGTMKLYLNGELVGQKKIATNSEIIDSGRPIRIGKGSESVIVADNQFDGTMFSGLMDEVSVSMSALSDTEIKKNGFEIPQIAYKDAKAPAQALEKDYYRPIYHATPPANWMNEPHSLFNYNNKWHLFYQSNQEGPYWHNISWGHWVSDDMVNWDCVEDAVVPMDDTIAMDGVWTGNVVYSSDGKPMLLITAGDDSRAINGSNQHVGLAKAVDYNDPELAKWEVVGFAVAQSEEMGTAGEFRDAQAFGIGNMRYMVVGGADNGKGVAHVFKTTAKTADEWAKNCKDGSLNGMNWQYMGSIMGDYYDNHEYKSEYGKVWELPNLVPLTDKDGQPTEKYLFVFSPQHGDNDVWYYIGDFDTETCKFTPDFENAKLMDYGNNIFTGPTVYTNPSDGKVYINSVMQENATGENGRPISDHYKAGWAFYAGLTRNLYLKEDGTLGIQSVDTSAIEGKQIVSFKNKTVEAANELLKKINSDCIKIDFSITSDAEQLGINLKESNDNSAKLFLSKDRLGLDNQSGAYCREKKVKGTIYVDKCSIEAYIDNSITVSGSKFFRGSGVSVFADEDATISMTVTAMNPIKMNGGKTSAAENIDKANKPDKNQENISNNEDSKKTQNSSSTGGNSGNSTISKKSIVEQSTNVSQGVVAGHKANTDQTSNTDLNDNTNQTTGNGTVRIRDNAVPTSKENAENNESDKASTSNDKKEDNEKTIDNEEIPQANLDSGESFNPINILVYILASAVILACAVASYFVMMKRKK